ncbi:MAG: hypothetical protein ABL995_10780 [Bryobacteraceae bacterium]
MPLRAALFLIPVVLLAQSPAAEAPKPPADVDQALRARATEFLQYNVDANYRKAYDMVAEDSKDFYFGMSKPQYKTFELSGIDYTDNFTKAMVRGSVKRPVSFMGKEIEMPMPVVDAWRLENGKWMWVQPQTKTMLTPLGEVPVPIANGSGANNSGGGSGAAPVLPKDFTPEAAQAAARELKVQATIDKKELKFTKGEASTQEVTFHNGLNGSVRIIATPLLDGGIFKADPPTAMVEANKDAKFTVHYDPAAGTPVGGPVLRLTVEPFQQLLFIPLIVAEPGQ